MTEAQNKLADYAAELLYKALRFGDDDEVAYAASANSIIARHDIPFAAVAQRFQVLRAAA
jgi:hypothetical protein